MPALIELKIEKLPEIKKLFKQYPQIISERMDVAVQRAGLMIERSAKRFAPVNKQSGGGNLRQSIRSFRTGLAKAVVMSGANYSVYVHEGTRPHIIRPVRKKGLANIRTGQYFGKIVHHPGTRANPFLQKAIDSESQYIQSEFAKVIDNLPTT
jgi:HK97 gp10 family phage protein